MSRPLPPLPLAVKTFEPVEEPDGEDLIATVERRPARVTTLRLQVQPAQRLAQPPSVPAFAIDVPCQRPAQAPRTSSSAATVESLVARILAIPQARIAGAALVVACVVAGLVGVVAGHESAPAAVLAQRAPRVAVVIAADEEITELPLMAAAKIEETTADDATTPAPSPAPRRAVRSGFRHMGSDRTAPVPAPRRRARR